MNPHLILQVDFIGGPIDGHVDQLSTPLEPLLGLKIARAWSVRRFWASLKELPFRWLNTQGVRLAIYELAEHCDATPYYRFLGTQIIFSDQIRGSETPQSQPKHTRNMAS